MLCLSSRSLVEDLFPLPHSWYGLFESKTWTLLVKCYFPGRHSSLCYVFLCVCVCALDLNHNPLSLWLSTSHPLCVSLALETFGVALGFNDKNQWEMKAFIPSFQKYTFLKTASNI